DADRAGTRRKRRQRELHDLLTGEIEDADRAEHRTVVRGKEVILPSKFCTQRRTGPPPLLGKGDCSSARESASKISSVLSSVVETMTREPPSADSAVVSRPAITSGRKSPGFRTQIFLAPDVDR